MTQLSANSCVRRVASVVWLSCGALEMCRSMSVRQHSSSIESFSRRWT